MTDENLYPSYKIMIVDDEVSFLHSSSFALKREGITNIETISDSRNVVAALANRDCGILILDMLMPYMNGMDILKIVMDEYPDVSVIVLTAVNQVESAVQCMKMGAVDYILKPIQHNHFTAVIKKIIENKRNYLEKESLKASLLDSTLKHPEIFSDFNTVSVKMINLFKYAEVIAPADVPVLITGETGTGKELMASSIHKLSGCRGKFVCINAGGIDDSVLSDTLFGHVRGAFTGADRERRGMVEEASNGTLFLDEIADLKPESQVKILRLLQERTYTPIGSDISKFSSARIIAATNKNFRQLLNEGAFRKDLYYRLQSHEVHIPPLRERNEDIVPLSVRFIAEASKTFSKKTPYIHSSLYSLLSSYSWPGNIRELRGLLFDAVSRNNTDTLSHRYIKEKLKIENIQPAHPAAESNNVLFSFSLPTFREMELKLIQEAYKRTNGNRTLMADMLQLSRGTVIKRLKELNLVCMD